MRSWLSWLPFVILFAWWVYLFLATKFGWPKPWRKNDGR